MRVDARGVRQAFASGALELEWLNSRHLRVSKVHRGYPDGKITRESLTIAREDIEDLLVGLDAIMETTEQFFARWDSELALSRDAAKRAWLEARNLLYRRPAITAEDYAAAFDAWWGAAEGTERREDHADDRSGPAGRSG